MLVGKSGVRSTADFEGVDKKERQDESGGC